MKAKSTKERLRQVESLLKGLDLAEANNKEVLRLLPKMKAQLQEYRFLLEMLWLWQYKR